MAGVDSGDVTDDAAARQAAEVAVELSEAGGPADKKRIAARLQGIADRTTSAAAYVAASARRGADTAARRGAVTARKGAGSARRGASSASRGVTSGMNWLTAQVVAMGPRLRIRDQATLRAQFPGQTDDEIAQRLIERAARAAAAVGGTTGAWAALPVLPAFPAEVAAETLAVVGIEVKLVAELHEIYGMGAVGSGDGAGARLHRVVGVAPRHLPGGRRPAAHRGITAGQAADAAAGRPRPPVDVRARPAVHRRGGRGGAQPEGDAAARPRDQGRPAPAPQDGDRDRDPLVWRNRCIVTETTPGLRYGSRTGRWVLAGYGARVWHRGA